MNRLAVPNPARRLRPAAASGLICVFALLSLGGCGAPAPAVPRAPGLPPPNPNVNLSAHDPAFSAKPYEPFTREDAVAIAIQNWRLFGQPIDDDPPDTRPPPPPELKPEREPGLWERVGEYWWLGMDADRREADWTGKHDEYGYVFPASQDGDYAWSAAFISYIMRTAGAGARFPYSPSHSTYINVAREQSLGQTSGWVISAQPPDVYPPQVGDVICTGRDSSARLRFEQLPAGGFPAHCDIVVQATPGVLAVIGGNVDDAVTMKHVPTTAAGTLAEPGGLPVDSRYHWFVVLQVLYDR